MEFVDIIIEYLPIFMFLAMGILLFIGYPVGFILGGVAVTFGLIGYGFGVFKLAEFFNFVPRMWGFSAENLILVAIPCFIFMGIMMERSGIANDLLFTTQVLLRKVNGGLAMAVTVMGTVLAAMTGIIGASVTMMTALALPTMLKQNYSPALATGVIAASGTLGILIPPSIMLVVMGPIMEIPVIDLFAAAIIPGILLASLYAAYTTIRCMIDPTLGPILPMDMRPTSMKEVWIEFFLGLVPPAALVFAALGSILFGFATPTEAAGCGAMG